MKSFLQKPGRTRCLLSLAVPPMVLAMVALAKWVPPMALSVAFSPDGRFLATTSEGGRWQEDIGLVTVWNMRAGRRQFSIRPKPPARAVAFSADGSLLVTGHDDGSIVLWDAMTGARTKVLNGGQGPIVFLACAPGMNRLLSVSSDRAALRDLATPDVELSAVDVRELRSAAISNDGKRAAIATGLSPGATPLLCVYDISGGGFALIESFLSDAGGLAFSADASELALSSRGRKGIQIRRVLQPNRVTTLADPWAGAIAFSGTDNLLASAGDDFFSGAVRVWDLATGQPRHTLAGTHRTYFRSVAFSPNGRQVAAASGDGSTVVWDAVDGRQVAVVNGNSRFQWSLAALAALFALWSIAWVRSGRSLTGRLWPLVDIALLNGLVLTGLLLRQCLASWPTNVERLPAALAMGVVANIPALLFFWGAFGASRWQLRLPGVVAGLAAAWCIPLTVWEHDEAWQHLVTAVVFLTSLATAFEVTRSRGVRLLRGDADSHGGDQRQPERRQFALTDLLLWIAAAALFCAVARFAKPNILAPTGSRTLAMIGFTLAVVVIASVWTVFGKSAVLLRAFAMTGLTVGCGLFDHFAAAPSITLSWWLWPVALHASLATSTVTSLAVIHAYGFCLRRKFDPPPIV